MTPTVPIIQSVQILYQLGNNSSHLMEYLISPADGIATMQETGDKVEEGFEESYCVRGSDEGPGGMPISNFTLTPQTLQFIISTRLGYLTTSVTSVKWIVTCSGHCVLFRSALDGVNRTWSMSDHFQVNSKRADRALEVQVPRIGNELDESLEALTQLGDELPVIKSEVNSIADVYLSGHDIVSVLVFINTNLVMTLNNLRLNVQAKNLVSELEWLNTDFYERWRRVIFTSTSPVSWQWKAIMRSLFVISFMICFWLFWIAVAGAYRAHRHRLVWGDKLMS